MQNQVIIINEALQVLKKKKEISANAKQNWKGQARQTRLMTKVVEAFQESARDKSEMKMTIVMKIIEHKAGRLNN